MNQFEPVGDGKDWARKIMRRYLAGEKLNIYPLKVAREVLGVPEPPRVHRAHPRVAPGYSAPAPAIEPQALTPAEALYATEQAARNAGGVNNERAIHT